MTDRRYVERRKAHRVHSALLALNLVTLVALAVVGYVVADRYSREFQISRETAYRICERGERLKAYAVGLDTDPASAREVLLRELPVLDCTHNLRGEAAHPLSAAEAAQYVRDFEAGRLPEIYHVDPNHDSTDASHDE